MKGNARQYDKSATRKEEEAYYYSKRVREEEAFHQEKNYDYADKLTDEAARLFAFSEKLRVGRKYGKKGAEKKGLDSKAKHKISYHKRRIRKQIGNMTSHNQLPKNAMDLAGNKERQDDDFDVADDAVDLGSQIATSALMKTEKAASRITEKVKSGKYAAKDQWSGNPLSGKQKMK